MNEKDLKSEFAKISEEIAGGDKKRKSKMSRIWNSLKELRAELKQIKGEYKQQVSAQKARSAEARAKSVEHQRRNDEFYEAMLAEIRSQNIELEGIAASYTNSN